ncbi:MAG TPA: type II 3-dehydroquinate dehydratase [Acidimicrobiia bacterium]|nr:type II 3-dehydroquinate dehydratase [Acidimicrobiia bacterium]
MKVWVLNGPNLNLLGEREPELYGEQTLEDVEAMCRERGKDLGLEIDFRQSNFEGELVEWLQDARKAAKGVVLNAGALSHYSRAVADAVTVATVPVVEVHITNIHAREAWRDTSVISPVAWGVITGLGVHGYLLALDALAVLLAEDGGEEEDDE